MSYSNKSNVSFTWNTFTSEFICPWYHFGKKYSISSYHKPNRLLTLLFLKSQMLTYQISIVGFLFCQESTAWMIASCLLVDAIHVIQILQKETSALMHHKGISGWIGGQANTFNLIHIFEKCSVVEHSFLLKNVEHCLLEWFYLCCEWWYLIMALIHEF